jgi:uncharacterized repeat protein (TIGR01451 family)
VAVNVVLTDTLPSGLTFVSATPAPTTVSGQTLTWNLGDLAPGATGTFSVVAQLSGTATGSAVVNRATISTSTSDPDPTNNTSRATTTLTRPNVMLTKTGPATANAGAQLSYTLDYANTGDADAVGVVLTDTLPSGLTFVSATPAPTTSSGQTLTWSLGPLPAGATGRIAVVAQLAAAAPSGQTLTNTATIHTPSAGDDPRDNTSTATTTVTTPTAIQLAYFTVARQASGVLVRWGTLSEQNTLAFRILRGTTPERAQATLVATLESQSSQGADYTWLDRTAPASGRLYYWLVEVETGGAETPYGPAVVGGARVYLPLIIRK